VESVLKVEADKVRPLRNQVLVRLLAAPKVTSGGIHLPETVQDKKAASQKVGTVLAVGPGMWDHGVFRPVENVKAGDVVIFDPPYSAPVRGHDDLFLVPEDALVATVEG